LRNIFSSADLTPHGFCLLWREDLLLLNAASDAAIGLSYYVIPVALTYFVVKRRDVAFGYLFWMFAAFILACGTTHLLDIWTIWHPVYGLQGAIKLVTAATSVATAIAVWGLMPRALALPSPSQYLEVRTALTSEIEERQQVSEVLAETEQRYELLIESVTDYAIISLDFDGIVRDWNKGAERIKGYRADEVIGRNFSMFCTPADRDRGLPVKSLEEAAREGRYEAEGLRVRKDGTEFLANIVIQPMYDRKVHTLALPRSPGTSRSAGSSTSGSDNHRRWKRSASSPAGSRTTSTTTSPLYSLVSTSPRGRWRTMSGLRGRSIARSKLRSAQPR
jgi:PAS domain S-box-containing protein